MVALLRFQRFGALAVYQTVNVAFGKSAQIVQIYDPIVLLLDAILFRPFLSKKWDRVVHKSTSGVACPIASDLSAIRFYPNFCAERRKKPDILRHPVSKIGRGDRI